MLNSLLVKRDVNVLSVINLLPIIINTLIAHFALSFFSTIKGCEFNTYPANQGELTINDPHVAYNSLDLLLYSVGGISSPKTVKLSDLINTVRVSIMIDSGARHHFISEQLV